MIEIHKDGAYRDQREEHKKYVAGCEISREPPCTTPHGSTLYFFVPSFSLSNLLF